MEKIFSKFGLVPTHYIELRVAPRKSVPVLKASRKESVYLAKLLRQIQEELLRRTA